MAAAPLHILRYCMLVNADFWDWQFPNYGKVACQNESLMSDRMEIPSVCLFLKYSTYIFLHGSWCRITCTRLHFTFCGKAQKQQHIIITSPTCNLYMHVCLKHGCIADDFTQSTCPWVNQAKSTILVFPKCHQLYTEEMMMHASRHYKHTI